MAVFLWMMAALMGLAACLFGYAMLRVWNGLAAFLTGYALGWSFIIDPLTHVTAALWCGLLFGALLGAIGFLWRRGGMVFSGGVTGFCLLWLLLNSVSGASWPVAFAGAALGGAAALFLPHAFQTVGTAFGGALLLVTSLFRVITAAPSSRVVPLMPGVSGAASVLLLGSAVIIALCGVGIQQALYRRREQVDARTRGR